MNGCLLIKKIIIYCAEEEEDEEKEQQYVLINELKETAQKQREQLRSLQRENRQSNIDMDAVRISVMFTFIDRAYLQCQFRKL